MPAASQGRDCARGGSVRPRGSARLAVALALLAVAAAVSAPARPAAAQATAPALARPLVAPAPLPAQVAAERPRRSRTAAERSGSAGQRVALLPHRAAYRLVLATAGPASDVQGADGAMYYELADQCSGWTTQQRFTLNVIQRDGSGFEMGSDYVTFESADGLRMRHRMRQTSDGEVTQNIVGEARLTRRGAGTARYEEPEDAEVALPAGTLLPLRHTLRLLEAARSGRHLLRAPVFDGTSAHGAQDVNVVIGSRQPPGPSPFPPLAGQPSWPMRIAYFELDGQNPLPEYEVGVRYYANGIADEILMDFGQFTVRGRLTALDALPRRC